MLQFQKSSSIRASLRISWLQDFSTHVCRLSTLCKSMPKLKVCTALALTETWLVMGW